MIVDHLLREPFVEQGTGSAEPGPAGARQDIAMLVRGELVLKLPADRCEFLVAADGPPVRERRGRRLRQRVSVSDEVEPTGCDWRGRRWPSWAGEA